MPLPFATAEELVAALERSDLPNLITEGKTDFSLVRHLATKSGGDCLPAGNKAAVLRVADIATQAALDRTAFLVDSDLWVLDGVPAEYAELNHLVLTDGYSIENDLLRDANVESLIDHDEMSLYRTSLASVIQWFSAGVTARRAGIEFDFDVGINSILSADGALTPLGQSHVSNYSPSAQLIFEVEGDYPRLLRGKTWQQVLTKILCAQGRAVNHQPMSVLAFGMRSGKENSKRLIDAIEGRF